MFTLLWRIIPILAAVQCTIVEIPNGELEGSYNGEYYSFTNIPYGKADRFEAPLPYTDQWTEVRNASLPSEPCVQFDESLSPSNGNEDCLTLNIFTPDINPELPYTVRVHIIGGGLMTGDTGDRNEEYVVRQNIVLVIPNYRLGPFGFLSSATDLVSGNFGLKDQQLALKWVHENIHAFGGDPSKVLLTGVSAGGACVHSHLFNPDSWKYFHAAMSSSGCALNPWAFQFDPKKRFNRYIQVIGCDLQGPDEVKQCLQDRTKEEHFTATLALREFGMNPVVVFAFVKEAENVVNAFFTELPVVLIQRGLISTVPWVVSRSVREGSVVAAEFLRYDENGTQLIDVLNSRWREIAPITLFYNNSCVGCSEAVASKYRDDYSDYLKDTYMEGKNFSAETYPLFEKMCTDIVFGNAIKQAVLLHGLYSKGPVYAYIYDVPLEFGVGNALSMRPDLNFGADHGADLRYVLPSKIYSSLNTTYTRNDEFIGNNLIEMGRELTLTGIAKYDSHKLPINNQTQNGKMTIFETYYVVESYSSDTATYNKNVFNNSE